MTQSDIQFVERLLEHRLAHMPVHWPLRMSLLAAGAIIIGATLGFLT